MQPILYYRAVDRDCLSIKDALTIPSLPLSLLRKECPEKIEGLIVKCVQAMLMYYGFDPKTEKTVSGYQVHTLAQDILSKYYYFNFSDLCVCFKRARQNPGLYEKFYGKFDASVVMRWFAVYDGERDEILQSLPPDKAKVVHTGQEMNRDEYIECLEAMVAGGDLYANEWLIKVGMFERLMFNNKGKYVVYQYNRKHRLDEPVGKNGKIGWQR